MIQLHRLEGFFWVARTGGYARAARAFPYPLTQPAVHQQVRKLEDDLGLRLFERVGQAEVRLTPAGRHLYRFAAPFFEELPAVVRALRAGTSAGELRVAAEAIVIHHLLPGWLERLHRRLPDLRVQVQELPAADPGPVRTGDVDLAVGYFPGAVPQGLRSRQVATLTPFFVLPARHRLARRPRVQLVDLRDETFVTYSPGTVHRDLQLEALSRCGVRPARTVSASTADAILGLVAAGLGYSLVPSLAQHGPRRAGVVARPFRAIPITFPILTVWRQSTVENPAIAAAVAAAA